MWLFLLLLDSRFTRRKGYRIKGVQEKIQGNRFSVQRYRALAYEPKLTAPPRRWRGHCATQMFLSLSLALLLNRPRRAQKSCKALTQHMRGSGSPTSIS